MGAPHQSNSTPDQYPRPHRPKRRLESAVASRSWRKPVPQGREFWPGGARLVISISMPFEAGGPPPKGSDSPFPKIDLPARIPADLATNTWFAYGYREGILRMLDLWDRQGIKVTSHIISEAAQRQPALAKNIGHRHQCLLL